MRKRPIVFSIAAGPRDRAEADFGGGAPVGPRSGVVTAVRRSFKIVNQLGLHARAASVLVKLASSFRAEISVEKDGQRARSTSVIELLLLCGQPGSEVTIEAVGEDAERAVNAIGALIGDRFGEGV